MAIPSSTVNPSVRLWDVSTDTLSTASKFASETKNDPDGLQYWADLALELSKDLPAPARTILENVTVSEDATRIGQDANHFVSGAWRTSTYYTNFQMTSFVTLEVFGTIAAAAKIGLFSIASCADKLGGAASTLGNAFIVATGLPFIIGLTAAGYSFYGIDCAVKKTYVKGFDDGKVAQGLMTAAEAERRANIRSTNYNLLMARCATKVGACGLFLFSTAVKVTLFSPGTIAFTTTALIVSTLALAAFQFYYKRSYDNVKVIDDFENALKGSDVRTGNPEFISKHMFPVNRNAGEDTLFSKTFQVSEVIAKSNEPMEKVAKGIPSVIYCTKALATYVAETPLDNSALRYIASNEGVTTFAAEAATFSSTISGLKFGDRMREFVTTDDNGFYAWQNWTREKFNNRTWLTASHFMDFLRLIKTTGLVELSFLSAKVVLGSVILSVKMIKDAAVIGAAYWGYRNADAEIERNDTKANQAGSKVTKYQLRLHASENGFLNDKYSDAVVQQQRDTNKKILVGNREVSITKSAIEKHALLNQLTVGNPFNEANLDAFKVERSNKIESLDTLNKSWDRYFRGTEIRALKREIAEIDQILKVYNWYNPALKNSLTVYEGTVITLPNNNPVVNEGNIVLPVGSKIRLGDNELILKNEVFLSADGVGVVNGVITLTKDTQLSIENATVEQAYQFKNIGKAISWYKTHQALSNTKELLEEKRTITQRYEPCKALICAVGLTIAATSATALIPFVNVLGVIVSSMDVYKYVRERQIDDKKKEQQYRVAATSVY
ncbi:MAG: hypothetical protein WC222_00485 [Parachlamydiales bacterium]|jgi:hypothetical protein